MGRRSAGILLFRESAGALEVLLVHPGGPFWAKKDAGAWSIPKGEVEGDEDPQEAAKREFAEETGTHPEGDMIALGALAQPGGKTVLVWAMRGDLDAEKVQSNTFSMQWPPRSGREQEFPEVDRAEWFPVSVALQKILKGQRAFLEELVRLPR